MSALLKVEGLQTYFDTESGVARAVDGVSFEVNAGETVALVGESGCGKSVTAQSVMRLLPMPPARYVGGRIEFDGESILDLDERAMQKLRGRRIGMIFQEPMTSLNPVHRIGRQISESLRWHQKLSKKEARQKAIELLERVGIPEPKTRVDDYPHQLSGGMRQRVMIAMALSCEPSLVIADEPTTALDVTIQAQILDLLAQLQKDTGAAVLLITHDLGVVAEVADRVVVMYAGRVAESAAIDSIFNNPQHPYTKGLLKAVPSMSGERSRLAVIDGQVPPATNFPSGCRFRNRCAHASDVCVDTVPELRALGDGHAVACHAVQRGEL